MAKYCDVCKRKIAIGGVIKAIDGIVCMKCAQISNCNFSDKNIYRKINEIEKFYNINEKRKKLFKQEQVLKNFNSSVVYIDNTNKLFSINNVQIYYNFDDVVGYSEETVVGPTISKTKKKGGITRAIVGGAIAGPVGAMVGSNTAKSTTVSKTDINTEKYIEIEDYSGHRKVLIYNPPNGFKEVVNMWIQQRHISTSDNSIDNIEEIKKYKSLLDMGAITKEEFNIKKKELLNL